MLDRRHYLALLEPVARRRMLPAVIDALPPTMRAPEIVERVEYAFLIQGIPGIVCRPLDGVTAADGRLGFSFPFKMGSERVRAGIGVSAGEIRSFIDPWSVFRMATARPGEGIHPILDDLATLERELVARFGLIGSAALSTVTGAAYFQPGSDIDLLVDASEQDPPSALRSRLDQLSRSHGVKIDVELSFREKYGVKYSEYISNAKMIVVKTISEVFLDERDSFVEKKLRVSGGEDPFR